MFSGALCPVLVTAWNDSDDAGDAGGDVDADDADADFDDVDTDADSDIDAGDADDDDDDGDDDGDDNPPLIRDSWPNPISPAILCSSFRLTLPDVDTGMERSGI